MLLWEDNFDGQGLDMNFWNVNEGNGCPCNCGWGNNELQVYTKNNFTLTDGYLHLTAKKEGQGYTSAKITTKDKFEFRYGRIEIRAKLPVGKGVWPAFWLLGANIDEVGWPMGGEIDIMEYVGKMPGVILNAIHTQDSHGNTVNSKRTTIGDIEQGFHTYSANWTPDKIAFLVDGKVHYTFGPQNKTGKTWPFDKPFYIILNTAIGGNLGGPEVDGAIFPQDYVVDYVRVYKN